MNIEEYALHCDDADDEPSECKVCANNGNDYCFACDNGNKFKPMTNADRIRQMSDEKLARFIANQRGWYCDYEDPSEEEYPKVLSWLNAPAEEAKE